LSERTRKLAGLSPERLQGLIDSLRSRVPAAAAEPQTIGRQPRDAGPLPLSFAQERLWFLDRLEPGSPAYNLPVEVELAGELAPAALAGALGEVVRRHESLRTTFAVADGVPCQRISPALRIDLPLVDLGALPAPGAEAEARRLQAVQLARPFDLERGPLLAALLVRFVDGRHWFLLVMHHVVSDGWSVGVLVRELAALYEAFSAGRPSPLPELPIQYADYAVWQRRAFAETSRELDYWVARLGGEAAPLDLPADRPRPAVQTYRGGRLLRSLAPVRADRLRAFSREHGATLFMVLLAAVEAVFHRWSGQDDILLGTPIAGRRHVEVEGLIGIFLNTLVLRTDLSAEPSFRELLARVRERTLEAYSHQDVPFEAVLARLQPDRDLSRTPFFQVLFNLVNVPPAEARLPGLTLRELSPIQVPSKFDMTFYVSESGASIQIDLVYNADLFDALRMEELLDQVELLLDQAPERPEEPIGRLSLISDRARLALPDPAAPLDAGWTGAIQDLFAARAREAPARLAISDRDGAWSYGELDEAAGRVAGWLLAQGLRKGDAVAVWAHRSAPVALAVLGALRAGGAFALLDPAYPAARLVEMLRLATPRAFLSLEAAGPVPGEVAAWRSQAGCPVLDLPRGGAGAALARFAGLAGQIPRIDIGPDDVAVIGFTSGSTGTPKAILGRHGPLTHFLPWQCERFGLTAEDRFSLLSGLAHDPLQRDLFTPLYLGASIHVPDPEDLGVAGRIAEWMAREGVTVAHLTPAMAQLLTERPAAGGEVAVPSLRRVLLVGDALTRLDVARIRSLAPQVVCVNLYGSTETQRAVAYHAVEDAGTAGEHAKQVLPLGRGMPGVQLLVINPAGGLAGVGELGEIAVRSPHLALGYLGDEALTADRFRANPFTGAAGDRIYRTGDLGRYLPDGEVTFAGRADQQVKIRGFRIEPAEIEATLGAQPGLREAVVVAREDGGERRLVAYVVPEREGAVQVPALRQALRERLPAYMVPADFVLLERLPLTPNGKVSRRALPAPVPQPAEAPAAAAPSTDLEREIAVVWREVLGRAAVGVEDNFFDLGGHSLLLVRLHARLQQVLQREIPLLDLFAHPTVRAQAGHLGRRPGAVVETPRPPARPRRGVRRDGGKVAIIGMAGRFPRARDLGDFWLHLRDGIDGITDFSDAELIAAGVDPALVRNPKYVKARGVLEDEALFDAAFFDYSPRQAEVMDPQLRIFLECAWQALEDAGCDPLRCPGAIGVYGGVTLSTYLLHNLLSNPALLAEVGGYQTAIGTDRDFLTTQVSYKMGLRGPSIDVQTACSTSLVAVHLACRSLLEGECDMALAGGVSVKVPQVAGYLYQEGGLDSSDGRCRAFDAKADGSVYGSGAGVVVLKRLEDAVADGDTVHAVILGSAVNNDGLGKVGYTAPSIEAQAEVVATAQAVAGVEPATIQYVECHGTGTALGDPIEVAALSRAFGPDVLRGSCRIGSVKANIGHLGAAAGVAGLIKTVLALKHRQIPPSLHCETPSPKIDFASSPFRVNARLADWPTDGAPRRAGVSSFGLGGTNAHVVLEEAPEPAPSAPSRPWQILLLSAKTEAALEAATDGLAAWLQAHREAGLPDVAFTLQSGRRAFACRRALVCRDVEEARRALAGRDPRALMSAWSEPGSRTVAFLLPGVGDHYPGMARGLAESEPVFRRELDRCAEVLRETLGGDLREVIFAAERQEGDGPDLRALLGRGKPRSAAARRLDRTLWAQPAVFAVEYALAKLWESWGVRPDALIGYSLGEYVAACLAGVLSLEDALRLVAERARLIDGLPAGAMLAVPLAETEVRPLLTGGLDLAAVNGPQLSVVSGPTDEVAALATRLAERGVPSRELPTTHAFHSRMMEPAAAALTEMARRARLSSPALPYLSNVTGRWITPGEATDPGYWARHLCGTVRFADGLEALLASPSRVFLEMGPGNALSALALQHPAARGRTVVPSLPHAHDLQSDAAFLLGALGRLWLAGVDIDWAGFSAGERRRRLPLPTYPFERRRFWVEPGQGMPRTAFPAGEAAAVAAEPEPARPASTLHLRPNLPTAFVLPRAGAEARIAGLFGRILGVGEVGAYDSFFALGGHSLLGTRLLTRLRDELGVELPIAALFESPTPAELAARIEAERGGAAEAGPPIERLPRPGLPTDLPLSFAQERLWFLDQLQPGSAAYNIPSALSLEGTLDVAALARALTALARRHEVLRTTFPTIDGAPVQRIAPPRPFPLAVVDLAGLPEEARAIEEERLAEDEPRAPFDLAGGPLARATLVRLGESDHLLLATQHHIVSDGWSLGLFIREVATLYRAFASGEAPALPELPVQYADFASWQRRWLSGPVLASRVAWWRQRLTPPPPVLELPADQPRPAVETFRGGRQPLAVPAELTAALTALGRERGATLFMTLLAGFKALLARLTGQDDLAVGSPIAGRTRGEVEGLIGLFINTLVLRTDLAGDPTFCETLTRVRETALGAYAHQELPFERLVEELRPERRLGHSPLFQVLFILQNTPAEEAAAPGLTLRPHLDVYHGVSRFDLTLSATETGGGLLGYLEFKTDLLEAATAARWLGHLGTLLAAAAAEPERRLSELPVLSDAERRQLLDDWNDTATEVPAACVHRLIAERAARSPGDVAVLCAGERLTRAQLEDRAARLACRLRALGVGPESLVGIALERSLDLLVAALGVWKAGGAYLPLDPAYPAERIGFMLADSGVRVVLTQERLAATLPEHGARILCLDRLAEIEDELAAEPVDDGGAGPGHLAYVLYTSGSTGRPKGVQVTHGALTNFLLSMRERPGMGEEDVLVAVTSLSFDIAGLELYLPLIAGARLVVATREEAQDGTRLRDLLESCGATVLQATPATWRLLIDCGWRGTPNLRALCGGEALPEDLAAALLERSGAVWNLYGPTETTVWSTVCQVLPRRPVSIGRPIANTTAHLLDARGSLVPVGVPGELLLGGAGVARGYLGRPDLTAERFVPDPFSTAPGARLYRTGDLARVRPAGTLEYLGRSDQQVKIRGHRIELGEIEAALGLHPAVAQAAVVARGDRLAAYVVLDRTDRTDPTDPKTGLSSWLREKLPGYMVPSAFVFLAALPLTPNRKVDRRALPVPEALAAGTAGGAFVAPRNPVEEVLAGIWAEVLEVERVGIDDDFFALGGHSLLAARIASRAARALGTESPVRWIFERPTVRGLSDRIARVEGREPEPPIEPVPRTGDLPLSFSQERLWFLDRFQAGTVYNMPVVLRLAGDLDMPALAGALAEIVRRHEALRTAFPERAGRPRQEIAAPAPVPLPVLDLAGLPAGRRDAELAERLAAEVRRPFDLRQGPLLRATLLRLGARDHALALATHHIVCDAWSIGIFVRELSTLYAVAARSERSPLPEPPVQYADFAAWQRRWLTGERLSRLAAAWRAQLAGAPAALELPIDRPYPPMQTFRGGSIAVRLRRELASGLNALTRREGASLFMALLAAFQTLLQRYSRQEDLVVGTPIAGRSRPEIEGLIGVFLNTLALRGDLRGDPSFRELLARARETALAAYDLQDLPFERLLEELQPPRDLSRSPLFQTMLILQNAPAEALTLQGLGFTLVPVESGTAKLELLLTLGETEGEIAGSLEYNADLFDRATGGRLVRHFENLLSGAVEGPDARLSELPLLSSGEREQLVRRWSNTAVPIPAALVHELFEEQADLTPRATAVLAGSGRLTFAELDARANRLAHHLRGLGVGPEVLVGLAVERSASMVVALLGILKAGGAYLPLDPSYPRERLAYMLEDSGARVVVTERDLLGSLPACAATTVLLDGDAGEIARRPAERLGGGPDPDGLAYVLYTSGSTGRPKGVQVPHGALVNFLLSMRERPGMGEEDVLVAVTSLSFDIAGLEIYLPLIAGARLVVATREEAQDGTRLRDLLESCGATVLQATPATWRLLIDCGWRGTPNLRALCGGEALPEDLAAALLERSGAVWNLYGPTETTVWSTVCQVLPRRRVSIGRPIANTTAHLLDARGSLVPVGVPGELLLGGAGVARGYLGRPDLTAERFVPDPFSAVPGARLYRTGDLARARPAGTLEYLGRSDQQVKIRGHRIELGEIEAALCLHPAVAQAMTVVREDRGEHRLVAYVVPVSGQEVRTAELRTFLRERLPAYMEPSAFMTLAALPLTPNRKVDRGALPAPAALAADTAAGAFVAPRNRTEERLAELWSEILGLERVGVETSFFALGGHSILATRLMFRIQKVFQVDLPLRTLFESPTVAALAASVARRSAASAAVPAALPSQIEPDPHGRHLPFPLTDVQEAYWIGRSGALELGSISTHVYFEVDLRDLDLDRFELALRRLIDRHGMLRSIVLPEGLQQILPAVPPYRLSVLDLRGAEPEPAEAALRAVRDRMSHQVLPSDRWPLFEVAASRLAGERVRLHVSVDLLIGDAWSFLILARDLARLYAAPEEELPPLALSFRDYVLAEIALRESAAYRRDLEYWRSRLAALPPAPALPLAKSPTAIEVPRFVRRSERLERAAWSRLKERAQRASLTPSGVLLAVFAEVLAAWSRSRRLTINLTLFSRLPLHPQVDDIVGDFTSLTLLAVESEAGEPFAVRAQRLQERLWDDLDHRLVSGVRVLRELSRSHGEPRTIMPVVFTSTLNQRAEEDESPAEGERGFAISQTPQVWLDHQVSERAGALIYNWDAVEELFPAGLLDAMFGAYGRLLEKLAADEAAWREPVRGLLPAEQLHLIAEANATAAPLPGGLLHEPFLERARLAPDAPAVITSSRTLTYGELDRLSLALARRLRRLGAGRNRLVAVVMHKGWEQVAAVLAILRAGAAYLPVDARLPAERLRHLLARGEAAIALTQPGLEGGAIAWPEGVQRVVVESEDVKNERDLKDEGESAGPGDLAYVIFTSGSTGEPKGVMIDHRGALNTLVDVNRRFGTGPEDRVLALSSLSFDLSVWDVFGMLAAGGALVVPDAGSERDPAHWAELAARAGVTVWNTVPALMEMLVEYDAGRPGVLTAPLRLVLLSGDWIPLHLPDRIRAAFPGARVISLGGATEASIWSILYPVDEIGEGWTSIPYGRAMANQSCHVLDEDLEPCPVWVPGHLYIGGAGLALGYWRDEEKTCAAFFPHPRTGERLYRTGDLGRLLPSGDIEILGRDDTQVKIQGHRIELGEIEAALARHPRVAATVVSAVGERSGPKQLVAYFVPKPEADASAPPAVLTDPLERLRFKLAHHNLRPDEGSPTVALQRPELAPEQVESLYLRRRSFRRFLNQPLPLDALAGLLSSLLPAEIPGAPFPKHRYGSAGNLYPVQTWLHVKSGRVDGLAGGIYYHDPRGHRLVLVSSDDQLDASLWDPTNRAVFEEAAFAVFLVARLAAIAPLYGERARHFAILEAGLMTQLLEMAAPDHGIGLAQMGGLRFEAVRQRFALDESCELVHTLLGGGIEAAQTGLAAFLAEMAEQQALLRLLEEHPEESPITAWAPLPPASRSDADLAAELRKHLRSRLPESLVPALWVRLDALPLSANGKVDRKALPLPDLARSAARESAAWAPPETEIEKLLAGIVAGVLGVSRVGLHDNFFDLGASSVHIVRVHNALRDALGSAEIQIVDMFNHPSVSLLARRLAPLSPAAVPGAAAPAVPDPGAERSERLREGKDWRRQRLEKRRAAGGL
jgi:amino acid adenylation domain-containing protein